MISPRKFKYMNLDVNLKYIILCIEVYDLEIKINPIQKSGVGVWEDKDFPKCHFTLHNDPCSVSLELGSGRTGVILRPPEPSSTLHSRRIQIEHGNSPIPFFGSDRSPRRGNVGSLSVRLSVYFMHSSSLEAFKQFN